MDHAVIHRTEQACPVLFGQTLDALLAPIDATAPTGTSLRNGGVYQAIGRARRFDDTSLPMGAWQHEVKRADWGKVSQLAAGALAFQSKDLQLAAWLLEAQIHLHGFGGIAASLRLLQRLCADYWEELYPGADDTLDHRANVFRWINDKLPPVLRQVPLALGPDNAAYGLADWERARRHDPKGGDAEGAGPAQLAAAMSSSPSEAYSEMECELGDAIAVLGELSHTVSDCFGAHAPGLNKFGTALEQIRALLGAELYRRGIRPGAAFSPEPTAEPAPRPYTPAPPLRLADDPIADRVDAYMRLNEVASFLMRLEPHSPVPYLIRRASEWGQLNAAQLYQELFLHLGGQINVFHLLGIEAPGASAED